MIDQAKEMKRRLESGVDKLLGTMEREDGYITHIKAVRKAN